MGQGHFEIHAFLDAVYIVALFLYAVYMTIAVAYCRKNELGYKFAVISLYTIGVAFCIDILEARFGTLVLDALLGICAAIILKLSEPRKEYPSVQPKLEEEDPEARQKEIEAETEKEMTALASSRNNYRRRIGDKYFLSTPFKVKDSAKFENAGEHIADELLEIPAETPNIGQFAKKPFASAEILNFLMYCGYDKLFRYSVTVQFFGEAGNLADNIQVLRIMQPSLEDFDFEAIDKFVEELFDKSFDGWDTGAITRHIETSHEAIRVEQKNIEWCQMFLDGKTPETSWQEFANVKE
jgi:hypothetical protein